MNRAELIGAVAAAKAAGLSYAHFNRIKDEWPEHQTIGKRNFFKPDDVHRWAAQRESKKVVKKSGLPKSMPCKEFDRPGFEIDLFTKEIPPSDYAHTDGDSSVSPTLLSWEDMRLLFLRYNWLRCKGQDAGEIEQQIALYNMGLVYHCTERMMKKNTGRLAMHRDEILSACNIHLLRAIRSFQVDAGYHFSTYAMTVMQNGVYRQFRVFQEHGWRANSTSYSPALDPRKTGFEIDEDEEAAYRASRVDQLRECIQAADLTEREAKVIQLRWEDHLLLREVGEQLGVCKERVRQIEESAFSKIREVAQIVGAP